MTLIKTTVNRRSFLKLTALAGGGMMLGFNWACTPGKPERSPASAWFDINAYLTIADNGKVTIMSPNPEIGQNVKTAMPMIVAEELDCNWEDVIVKQAPLDTNAFTRQVAGGSQSIRQGWQMLRTAGAAARMLLLATAAKEWQTDIANLKTENGFVLFGEQKKSYAELASKAVVEEIPAEVELKSPSDFKIIGKSQKNVDLVNIVTGKPLFGIDYKREGMVYANVLRAPAFGQKLESFDDSETKAVAGVTDVFQFSDEFGDKIAVIGKNTWAVFKGKQKLKAVWKADAKLENTVDHNAELTKLLDKFTLKPERNDGNTRKAFRQADKVVERTYTAPFLPHNTLEPMNFFGHVTDEIVDLVGPIQTPEWTQGRVAGLLKRPKEEIKIDMTRMGGGFGRRLYGDFVLEVAQIADKIRKPVKLMWTREDDMTAGTYRPASQYKIKAAIKDGKLTAYEINGAGVNSRSVMRKDWFPAGGIENYRVESHNLESNITTGAWRAPITNFLAIAEQSFFQELADEMGMDSVDLRLQILEKALNNPTGEIDYEPAKMMGVIKLAAEKGKWNTEEAGISKGFSCYYSHNTYVAEVAHVQLVNNQPKVVKVDCAVDCGIVVNPDAAINQIQGGVVDGVGHAMYGNFSFIEGKPQDSNFNTYKLIRSSEAPKVDVHFVESNNDPTGLGEPSLPPAGGAVANAIAKATGKRPYSIPFVS